ncbi:hypothetical protein IAQ61_010678 [Plenodomus lingam]|uniref:uncharacterized protein n=1 Tax=Leptosphaeria maculans TaxID=5022 RepID=UPI00331AA8C0|nr:hypothetical protein IAQ61_010678 [Plenodomus lingam]
MLFNCGSCGSSGAPQYKLSCHKTKDLFCSNCLRKTCFAAQDELVRCPSSCCRGFMTLSPFAQALHLNTRSYDIECVGKVRNQSEVMNNLIGFTRDEAMAALQHVYSIFEDQILDPVAFGGAPGYITAGAQDSFGANVSLNPFYNNLLKELTSIPKMMTTPLELEEDLNIVLTRLLHSHTMRYYEAVLAMSGVDMTDEEAIVEAAIAKYSQVRDIKDNWTDIIQKWVELLTWRHLERLAPTKGSAA